MFAAGAGIRRNGNDVAAVIVSGDRLSMANVGDSRVYLMREGVSSNSRSTTPGSALSERAGR